jgi:hypothetical protein
MAHNDKGDRHRRSFWASFPGIVTAVAAFVTATGGLIGTLYAVGVLGHQDESTSRVLKTMIVHVDTFPSYLVPDPGTSTWTIRVEALSGPNLPIGNAHVTVHMGGGSFIPTSGVEVSEGGLEVEGETGLVGFFAAQWQSPPSVPSGYGYLIGVSVTKDGYEPSFKRITLSLP